MMMSRTLSAGVGASGVEPVYRTSAFLNVGDDLRPVGLGLDVLSIPTSRFALGVDPTQIANALTGEDTFEANAPTILKQHRYLGETGPMIALSWTVTAAAIRALNRRDLDPEPGNLEGYADHVWAQLSQVESQILGASQAPLFVVENSPPVYQTAASITAGGVATVSFAAGHMTAATIVMTPVVVFLITAAPIAGKAFGEYLQDLIRKLPGSSGS